MLASGCWRDFIILGSVRLTAFQNYQNYLSRPLEHAPHWGNGLILGSHSTSLGVWAVQRLAVASLLILLFPPHTERIKRKFENDGLTHFPLTLDPSHSDHLYKHHQK